jgi:acyl dehydratase
MNLEELQNLELPPIEHAYSRRDTMLYGLGLGYGTDPLDPAQLRYVYEDGLEALPSMSVVLAHPGFWLKDAKFGVDWAKMLHGEQSFELHKPIPPEGKVRGEYGVASVEDRGDRGAVLHQSKELIDVASGDHIASVRTVLMLRADGGKGGFGTPPGALAPLPERPADRIVKLAIPANSALIYRLSGDYNPIHADPELASKAGFDRPILQGLCTMGFACRAIMGGLLERESLVGMSVRFSRPVYPGETLAFEIFEDGEGIGFRAKATERDVLVLDRGRARIAR